MDKPLREVLQGAIRSRRATLYKGVCGRTNFGHMFACLSLCEKIVDSYRSDGAIRQQCRIYREAVCYVVPANQPEVLQALVG